MKWWLGLRDALQKQFYILFLFAHFYIINKRQIYELILFKPSNLYMTISRSGYIVNLTLVRRDTRYKRNVLKRSVFKGRKLDRIYLSNNIIFDKSYSFSYLKKNKYFSTIKQRMTPIKINKLKISHYRNNYKNYGIKTKYTTVRVLNFTTLEISLKAKDERNISFPSCWLK